jgi:hypothetical protein
MNCLRRERLDQLSQVDRHLLTCVEAQRAISRGGVSQRVDVTVVGWAPTEGLGSSSTHLLTWTAHTREQCMSDDGSTHPTETTLARVQG